MTSASAAGAGPVTRPGWDAYFLGIAWSVSQRADCRRRQIGCVIVDEDRRIVSTGYNGAPSGAGSCLAGDCPRGRFTRAERASFEDGNGDLSDCISLHAEQNAIAWADRSRTKGATIYVVQRDRVPVPCCDMCAKLVKAAGIVRVVTDEADAAEGTAAMERTASNVYYSTGECSIPGCSLTRLAGAPTCYGHTVDASDPRHIP